jgi:hypothetical protein
VALAGDVSADVLSTLSAWSVSLFWDVLRDVLLGALGATVEPLSRARTWRVIG